jgi:prevent-host-death family protein
VILDGLWTWFSRVREELAMTTVNIHAAKTHLSRLVEQAASGDEIVIAKGGKPIAKLGPRPRP